MEPCPISCWLLQELEGLVEKGFWNHLHLNEQNATPTGPSLS